MIELEKYPELFDTNQLTHIPEISVYNSNYYIGLFGDLLFGKSDDDNRTEWYLVRNEWFYYLGESYFSEGDRLRRYEEKQT